jgi:ATP-dependent HslUV protease subunit HslV
MPKAPSLYGKRRSTTIIMARHNGTVAVAGDGQVSLGPCALKRGANKIRKLYHDRIICGFAGATSDALTILERFEDYLSQYSGHFTRAAVELTKLWRTDRGLRHLEAVLVAADREKSLLISGSGDVLEPDDNLLAIGSGGFYALAAARALVRHAPSLDAASICRESLKIASEICVFTNGHVEFETLDCSAPEPSAHGRKNPPPIPKRPIGPPARADDDDDD